MLRVYNTLTRKKDVFEPYNPIKVGMYVCGVTVYDHCHIGHARSFVAFDFIRRYLQYKGYLVNYIYNITDIDDKIIDKANSLGVTYKRVSEKYIESFFDDLEKMRVLPASFYPKATENITDIQNLISNLIKKGFAYEREGSVYFSVRKFKSYGKLSGRNLDFNVIQDGEINKVNVEDFALWKNSKAGEPSWDSPWGAGRPGWHIECSAMSMKYLGESFDIHGGGNDLIFPHHENEIAQSEAATGSLFAKYWLHNGMVIINEKKMAKSSGNFFYLKDILEKYESDIIKLYILSSHYRSPLEFSEELLLQASEGYKKIKETVRKIVEEFSIEEIEGYFYEIGNNYEQGKSCGLTENPFYQGIVKVESDFFNAMDDDFNTAIAIASIFKLINIINVNLACKHCIDAKDVSNNRKVAFSAYKKFKELSNILGLFSDVTDVINREKSNMNNNFLQILINLRDICKKDRNWDLADTIRKELEKVGIEIRDTSEGTKLANSL